MRIRTIKPSFWRSDDITALPMELRLLFIGLWSYVDDNGVGIDDYRQIAADLFALEEDQAAIRSFVRDGLATLSRRLQVVRYMIAGKPYLFIPTWDLHQKVDRPAKARYPRPPADFDPSTSKNGQDADHVATSSREVRDTLAAVVGEEGIRGREEKDPSGAVDHATPDRTQDDHPQPSLPDPPPGPAVTGPRSSDAFRLVNQIIGIEHPSAVRTALAIEAGGLLTAGHEPELIAAALGLWLTKPHLGPRTLPSLASEVIRTRDTTDQPLKRSRSSTTDQRIADILALRAEMGGDPNTPLPDLFVLPGGAA
jgi:hypothetical protein